MRSRTSGMWWGTAIECVDPVGVARFYSELLGLPVVQEDATTAIVACSPQGPFLVFHTRRTTWRRSGHRSPASSAR